MASYVMKVHCQPLLGLWRLKSVSRSRPAFRREPAVTSQNEPSTYTLDPLVRKLEYWLPLDPADRAALLALPHKVKHVEAHDYIVRQGDRTEK